MDTEALTLSRGASALQDFSDWLDRRVDGLSLPPRAAFAMRICLEEAVLNSFNHAAPEADGDHPITVWAGIKDGAPAAWIEDDGPPFNPAEAELPEKPGALETATVGGAGLRLMRHYAKQLRYQRIEARNRLELVFEAA